MIRRLRRAELPANTVKLAHFLIGGLRKILVPLADRVKVYRRVNANKIVHFRFEFVGR